MKVLCPSPEFYYSLAREHAWYDYLMRGFKQIAEVEYSSGLTKFASKFFDKSLLMFEIQGRKIIYDYSDFTGKQVHGIDDAEYFKVQALPKDGTKPIGQVVMDVSFMDKLIQLREVKDQRVYDYDVVGLFRTTNMTWRYKAVEIVNARPDWRTMCGLHVNNLTENVPEPLKRNRLKYDAYLNLQVRSKLVLVFAGLGGKAAFSWRLTEALAMGCAVVTHFHDTVLPNHKKFQQGIIEVSPDLKDLESVIEHYLQNDVEREQIAQVGREYFEKYLAPKQMAQRLIKGAK